MSDFSPTSGPQSVPVDLEQVFPAPDGPGRSLLLLDPSSGIVGALYVLDDGTGGDVLPAPGHASHPLVLDMRNVVMSASLDPDYDPAAFIAHWRSGFEVGKAFEVGPPLRVRSRSHARRLLAAALG